MFLIRDLGSAVRGAATGPQIVLATTLGAMLGFVPGFFLPGDVGGGFLQAPGLILALSIAALVLDTNLLVFGLATLGAKLASIPGSCVPPAPIVFPGHGMVGLGCGAYNYCQYSSVKIEAL